MAAGSGCRRWSWRPRRSGGCARRLTRDESSACAARCAAPSPLRNLLEVEHASFEVDADAVAAQELVADDAAELKPEQRTGRVQVQHHDREVRVANGVEREIDARQQERVAIPSRGTKHLQRNLPGGLLAADRRGGRL